MRSLKRQMVLMLFKVKVERNINCGCYMCLPFWIQQLINFASRFSKRHARDVSNEFERSEESVIYR